MPSSRLRLPRPSIPRPGRTTGGGGGKATAAGGSKPVRLGSPRWLVPLMLGFFLVGLLWIVVYYITAGAFPVPALGNWNIAVGFGFISVGFVLSTQWR
ncbi:MAG: cell division protein CrgA [Actinomycetota bacterium]|nr:cell division protein CrgA [Actinomycetota bacterium]